MAVPKGSLQKLTSEFFKKTSIEIEDYDSGSRNYRPKIGMEGVEIKVLRPQEIPILVSRGYYDIGISGLDWYRESRCENNVEDLLDLGFGKVDIVLAVPDSWSDINSPSDLFDRFNEPSHPLRIWTEYINLTEDFVFRYVNIEPTIVSPYMGLHRGRHSPIIIFHSFGATESKPPEDGEAIIDNTETGRTLVQNNLKILHKVLPASTARLLANRRTLLDKEKEKRIEAIRNACEVGVPAKLTRSRVFNGHIDF
ncbi:MAG: ATP phosphoribosyltransferase [Deltaproteobacteria bacterium]|uniref:ATP phosphoribosyltransferase n=1 Tax=Candidatus Zymogenus saltonus TaxID=2844893 RepID=A0A9D8KFH6_9DELT|nr:ATP phosphoribosyltransferase [Candidatus Zymogenus saltonus]